MRYDRSEGLANKEAEIRDGLRSSKVKKLAAVKDDSAVAPGLTRAVDNCHRRIRHNQEALDSRGGSIVMRSAVYSKTGKMVDLEQMTVLHRTTY